MIVSAKEACDILGIGLGELWFLVLHAKKLKRKVIAIRPHYRYGFDEKEVRRLL